MTSSTRCAFPTWSEVMGLTNDEIRSLVQSHQQDVSQRQYVTPDFVQTDVKTKTRNAQILRSIKEIVENLYQAIRPHSLLLSFGDSPAKIVNLLVYRDALAKTPKRFDVAFIPLSGVNWNMPSADYKHPEWFEKLF